MLETICMVTIVYSRYIRGGEKAPAVDKETAL